MGRKTEAADRIIKDIRRQTRKRYSSEEKIFRFQNYALIGPN